MQKDIFIKVINNKILRSLIFESIKHIHKVNFKVKSYRWNSILNRIDLLAYYNYLDQLKFYINNNKNNNIFHNLHFKEKVCQPILIASLKGKKDDVFKYFIKEYPRSLTFIYTEKDEIFTSDDNKGDLLFFAIKYHRFDIIDYLEQLSINSKSESAEYGQYKIEWNYVKALTNSPLSNDFDSVKRFELKIRNDLSHLIKKNIHIANSFIIKAAYVGRVDMIEWFLSLIGECNDISNNELFNNNINNIIRSAIIGNQLDFIKKYIDKFEGTNSNLGDCAAQFNRIEILQYLDSKGIGCSIQAMNNAASKGNLDIIKWLHHNRTEGCTAIAMDYAAENGHIEVVQWLHENRTEGCTSNAYDGAALNGHLEIVKWLHHNRNIRCSELTIVYAAQFGHLEVLQWLLHNKPISVSSLALDHASKNGHMEIIKWLHENRTESCSTNAIDWAAHSGHVEIVKWLLFNRTEGCSRFAMCNAAEYGSLEIIKLLHENSTNGCTNDAMKYAAMFGHLDVLIWLHENRTEGCASNAMDFAARHGQLETVKWLYYNRTECSATSAMAKAKSNGYLEVYKWLEENSKINKNDI